MFSWNLAFAGTNDTSLTKKRNNSKKYTYLNVFSAWTLIELGFKSECMKQLLIPGNGSLFHPRLPLHHNHHLVVIWVCAMNRKSHNPGKSYKLWFKLIPFSTSRKLQAGCSALSAFQIHHHHRYNNLEVISGIERTGTDLTFIREQSPSSFCHHVVPDEYSVFSTILTRSGKEVQDELLIA